MTNFYRVEKATAKLEPGDVVLHGKARCVVTKATLPAKGCVVRVDLTLGGRPGFFLAGDNSMQVVEVMA